MGIHVGGQQNVWRDEVDVLARGASDVVEQIPQYIFALTIRILENGSGREAIL